MKLEDKKSFFRKTLLNWFDQFGRWFPWREQNTDNYTILISEILLQKTKAEIVANFFDNFFSIYPNWAKLGDATLEELEKTLKPIGLYKHRAKRLHVIAENYKKYGDRILRNRDKINEFGFSGLYVGNAYELFVLNKRKPLIDVNMSRLLKRYFMPGDFIDVRNDKELQVLANEIVNTRRCKELNWAILDYSAAICKSRKPLCELCIMKIFCKHFNLQQPDILPFAAEPTISYQVKIQIYPQINLNKIDKTVRSLSLFSGCGGMDIGLEGNFIVHKDSINPRNNPDFIDSYIDSSYVRLTPTIFQTVFANDILPDAKTAWINHFTKLGYDANIFHLNSIVELVKLHKAGVDIFPENVDIVTGGFPCQDFSISGSRNGFNSHKDHLGHIRVNEIPNEETRGKLYIWMKEVIEITKPKIFIAENVKGLVNLSNIKDIIQNDFSRTDGNDYIVLDPKVLHAGDYGIPQSRERVIFIGIRKSALNKSALKALLSKNIPDEYNPYPKPSHAFNSDDKGSSISRMTLRKIFSELPEPENSDDLSQKYYSKAKYMGAHCQGQIEINLDNIGPTIRAEHHGNIEYRRLSIEHGGKNESELAIGRQERRLTPRECALIQTFPPDYEFVIPSNSRGKKFLISPSGAYKIIGNAVPPLLAYHIGKRIEKLWSIYFD